MRDKKILTYTIVASILVHVFVLVLVGRTSAAKPIVVDHLKIVRVDLVKTPDQIALNQDKPDAPKPAAEHVQAKVDVPYVPPVNKMVTDKTPPKPVPVQRPAAISGQVRPSGGRPTYSGTHTHIPAGNVPGNPGGELNTGSTSDHGQDMGSAPSGNTPVGWVPSNSGGSGAGSGTGHGVGTPDPTPADDGPGTRPSPAPITPPSPKMVPVTVCAVSGDLPGKYCEKKDTRSFREGDEPRGTCDRCKAPEPHKNQWADRSEPELIKDVSVKLPDIDESGDYTISVAYTVDTDGGVKNVDIVDGSGIRALDKAVRDAISKRRYKPAVQNGEPRSVKMKIKYKISL